MALYELKDFLTFDDVADYLTDKGVYEFDISQEYDYRKLQKLIWELIYSNKLTLLYPFVGFVKFEGECDDDENPKIEFIRDYIVFGEDNVSISIWENLMKNNNVEVLPFEFHGFYKEQNRCYASRLVLLGDDEKNVKGNIIVDMQNVAFAKCELDNLFLQKQKETLQNQINSIDSQLDNKELTATSQKSVAKLLYALLKEHNYELGATKGATNDTLFNLCESHNVKLSRETIAKWLDRVNDLEKQIKSII